MFLLLTSPAVLAVVRLLLDAGLLGGDARLPSTRILCVDVALHLRRACRRGTAGTHRHSVALLNGDRLVLAPPACEDQQQQEQNQQREETGKAEDHRLRPT